MAPIVEHADIRRSLMTMKSMTQAARSICLMTARELDLSHRLSDPAQREAAAHRAALLTPIAKAFSTDIGCEVASMGIQIHGGMGFIEETGAAQYYRDARILPIYEGTNGIQAIDLVTRKLPLGGGAVVKSFIEGLRDIANAVSGSNQPEFGRMGDRLGETISALEEATAYMGKAMADGRMNDALAGATPYLRLFGLATGGAYLANGALEVVRSGDDSLAPRIAVARFFAENLCVAGPGLAASILDGANSVMGLEAEQLAV